MRHIRSNKIVSVSADSENPNFPVTRVLDEHPKRPWQAAAGVNIATVTADVVGGCSDIMVAGTNAASASVVVSDPNATQWSDTWGKDGELSAAANAIIATTANVVDVFVYDTRNDSDGGRWVESATYQSWYTETLNTATRGSKREFPKVALIIAETNKVTIYDATDTDCPMWMVFQNTGVEGTALYANGTLHPVTSIFAIGGIIVVGSAAGINGGLSVFDFLRDVTSIRTTATKRYYSRNIAGRNLIVLSTELGYYSAGLINKVINDVAMTTISRAENAYGLLDPVIAVATDGGVSVIDGPAGVGTVKDFGDVAGDDTNNVAFDSSGNLWYTNETQAKVQMFLSTNLLSDNLTPDYSYSTITTPSIAENPTSTKLGFCAYPGGVAIGHTNGITLINHETGTSQTIASAASITALHFDFGKQLLHAGSSSGHVTYLGTVAIATAYDDGLSVSSNIKSLSAFRGSVLVGTASQAYAWNPPSYTSQVAEFSGGDFDTISASVIQRSQSQALWIQLSETVDIPCEVDITLSGPGGGTLYAGVITAGIADTYGQRNPKYGMVQGRKDFSIFAENSNGSLYYKKRDIVRTFDMSALFTREDAIRLQDSYEESGKMPSAWKLTDATGNDFVIFGRFNDVPQISHNYLNHSDVSIKLIEVL